MSLLVNEILEILRGGDSFCALEHLQRQGSPLQIAARYESLVLDLYWKAHDLPATVLIGRAGILHCLGCSVVADAAPESVEQLRSIAKAIAYNLGSFTWPGWEEPGIAPTSEHLAFGQDCAGLNLRLALELHKPPKALSKAYWLIGAHALASRDFNLAESAFHHAQEVFTSTDADTQAMHACNAGYFALARLCKNRLDATANAQLEMITARLAAQPTDEAQAYLAQLLTAHRLFMPKTPV
jgi:hypothetical protein